MHVGDTAVPREDPGPLQLDVLGTEVVEEMAAFAEEHRDEVDLNGGNMSEEEREQAVRETDEERDVEAHMKRRTKGAEPPDEAVRESDEPDVEAHMKR